MKNPIYSGLGCNSYCCNSLSIWRLDHKPILPEQAETFFKDYRGIFSLGVAHSHKQDLAMLDFNSAIPVSILNKEWDYVKEERRKKWGTEGLYRGEWFGPNPTKSFIGVFQRGMECVRAGIGGELILLNYITLDFATQHTPPYKWIKAIMEYDSTLAIVLEYFFRHDDMIFKGVMGRDNNGKLFDNYVDYCMSENDYEYCFCCKKFSQIPKLYQCNYYGNNRDFWDYGRQIVILCDKCHDEYYLKVIEEENKRIMEDKEE